jgi:hypothetical protein
MANSNVTLPADVKALADARAAAGGYGDVGEYIAELIRDEASGGPPGMTLDSDADVEALLQRRSQGPSVVMDDADFDQIREKVKAAIAARREARP